MRICEANTRILRAMPQLDIDAMPIGRLAPASTHQRIPQTAENRTLCRARALSKREAFVASGRGRRQAAEAGADLRSKYADSPRKASTRYGCDVIESQPAVPRSNAEWDALSQRQPRRKLRPGIRAQTGALFPDGSSSGNCDPESSCRVGHAFPMAAQAESKFRNPHSEWDAVSK